MSNEKQNAFVISGAGAKVIISTGMAKAVLERFDYSVITGTSSGAIETAFIAAGQFDVLCDFMLKVRDEDVFSQAEYKAITHEASLLDNMPLRKTLKKLLDCDALRKNPRDVIVNVTDLQTWNVIAVALNKLQTNDEIYDAILASTAIPCAFPCRGNKVDGGMIDDFPVLDVIGDKVDRIFWFVPSTAEPSSVHNIIGMAGQAIDLMLYAQYLSSKRALQLLHPDIEIVVIQPDKPTGVGLLDFSGLGSIEKRQAFIDLGYEIGKAALANVV